MECQDTSWTWEVKQPWMIAKVFAQYNVDIAVISGTQDNVNVNKKES